MKTESPITSEMVEHTMGLIIGRLWYQCEEVQDDPYLLEDRCCSLWMATKAINRISTVLGGKPNRCAHFSIAMGNNMSMVSSYIKEKLDFNPWHDKDHMLYKMWNS